jgi:hypothetical protein
MGEGKQTAVKGLLFQSTVNFNKEDCERDCNLKDNCIGYNYIPSTEGAASYKCYLYGPKLEPYADYKKAPAWGTSERSGETITNADSKLPIQPADTNCYIKK